MIAHFKRRAPWRRHLPKVDTFGQIFGAMALHGVVIVLAAGGISFGFLQRMIKSSALADIEAEAKQEAAKFEQLIRLMQEEVRNLSENTLFINAIVDTAGAKAYLDPFLKSYRPKGGISVRLTLCDYRGVPISSNVDGAPAFRAVDDLRAATAQGRAFAAVVSGPETPPRDRLALAYPVVWPGTGTAEGSLLAEIDVDVLRRALGTPPRGEGRQGLVIRSGRRPLLAADVRPGRKAFVVTHPLRLPDPLGRLGLSVDLLDYTEPHLEWFFLLYAAATAAFLALTVYIARHLAILLTARLRKAQEEREQLEAKMRQAQKLESLGVLAGGIAHDFNNLLMGVLGNADLALSKCPPDSTLRVNLDRIVSAATRAADLTSQMLAYSGKGRVLVEPVNLSELVEEMGRLLDTVISKRVSVRYDLAPNLPSLAVDSTQIRQVVMNLITNASDSIGEGAGQITISTSLTRTAEVQVPGDPPQAPPEEREYVCLEVTDTGAGMDLETQARIFDPFFSTKQMGRGLGLAAVIGIVRGHRGGIEVQSELGKGTTFKVLLPAAPSLGAASRAPSPEPQTPAATEPAPQATILLVDDEESVRSVARSMLEQSGLTVLLAGDGVEAVELFRKHCSRLSAVVLDVTMPRMGGDEACLEMRRIDPRVPVILSSGYGEEDSARRFPACRPEGYLQKPYRREHLLQVVRETLNARFPGAGPASS